MALTLNGDDGIAGVDGSATTPAIQGTDSNTGISFGTDTVNVVTGGSTRTTVDSSGRLLVGTTSSRNVGTYGFEAKSQIEGTSGVVAGLTLTGNRNDFLGPYLVLGRSRGTTAGSSTVVQNNDELGTIQFCGADGTDLVTAGAQIRAEVDGTPGANDMPGRLVFSTTADGASSPTEHMRIAANGRVTINTASQYTAIKRDNAASGSAICEFQNSSGTVAYMRLDGGLANVQSNDLNLSDEREKKNIESLDSTWSCLKNWELKKFHYNDDADTDNKRYGVIAQQIVPHCPEVISDWLKPGKDAELDEDGNIITPAVEEVTRMGVKEQQMMWMAIKALQEAQTRIEQLETRVAQLEGGAS